MKGFVPRDPNSIRRKYSTLHRKKAPTGDPNMREDVMRAKRIKHKIKMKANLGDGEDVYVIDENVGEIPRSRRKQ